MSERTYANDSTSAGITVAELNQVMQKFKALPPTLTLIEVNREAYRKLKKAIHNQPVMSRPGTPEPSPFGGIRVDVDPELESENYPCGVLTFSDGRKEKTDFSKKPQPTFP